MHAEGKLMKQFGTLLFLIGPPTPFQLTPQFLSNFVMTPLSAQISKTRNPLILGWEETVYKIIIGVIQIQTFICVARLVFNLHSRYAKNNCIFCQLRPISVSREFSS